MARPDDRYATPEAAQRARASRKAASDARDEAVRRLKAENPERWRELYAEEARKRGITPAKDKRAERIARLEAELQKLKTEPKGDA